MNNPEGQTQEPVLGWTSVKERLPKNRTEVIVWYYKKKTFREDYYTNLYGDTGWAHSESMLDWIIENDWVGEVDELIGYMWYQKTTFR